MVVYRRVSYKLSFKTKPIQFVLLKYIPSSRLCKFTASQQSCVPKVTMFSWGGGGGGFGPKPEWVPMCENLKEIHQCKFCKYPLKLIKFSAKQKHGESQN